MQRLHRTLRDESGMSLVFVGFGMMAFLGASMLAIDVGMLMTSRNQAQNSADAGALAGATALYFDDFDNRSATGPAVTSAIATATANNVMALPVSVTPADVEFQTDDEGESNRVKVTVYRTAARGSEGAPGGPLSTLIARYFGINTADISATATAEASPANAMTCVKPFTIPDKWREMGEPPWSSDSTYDAFDKFGNPLPPGTADVYIPSMDANGKPNPDYTGYNNSSNKGQRLVIRAGQGQNITVSFYYSLAMTDDTGGDDFRWNIANCNHTIYHIGDLLVQEPGDKEGPTIQGVEELIARDPGARWNDVTNELEGSAFPGQQSPRVFPIPLFDPEYYDAGKRNGRIADLKTANWIGFFAEQVVGSQIYGRIIPIAGIRDKYGPKGSAAFPKAIRLVK